MARLCEQCGCEIEQQKGPARPRKYCTTCRPPRNRRNPRLIDAPQETETAGVEVSFVTGGKLPQLVESYRARLQEAGRLDTPEGAHAMHLAQLLATGEHTASGAASLSRELRMAMAEALKHASDGSDPLDELEQRRRAKATSA